MFLLQYAAAAVSMSAGITNAAAAVAAATSNSSSPVSTSSSTTSISSPPSSSTSSSSSQAPPPPPPPSSLGPSPLLYYPHPTYPLALSALAAADRVASKSSSIADLRLKARKHVEAFGLTMPSST